MEANKAPRKQVKFVLRKSPVKLKVALTLLIVFSMAALVALRWVHLGLQEQVANLTEEAAAIEYDNAELEQKRENIGSVQSIQDIAKEDLGLVDPDTVLIDLE